MVALNVAWLWRGTQRCKALLSIDEKEAVMADTSRNVRV